MSEGQKTDASVTGTEAPSKRFLYMVQSRGALPPSYASIVSAEGDLLRLTFKEQIEGALFYPKSSWSQGRNRLLEEARALQKSYLYYIFLDEDVVFSKGGWRSFEEALIRFQPAVATPFYTGYGPTAEGSLLGEPAQTVHSFDAMFNAFHRDVILDGLLVPYHGAFDAKSWWYSQLIIITLSQRLYGDQVMQLNDTWVENAEHGSYPQEKSWHEVLEWLDAEVMATDDSSSVRSSARRIYRASRVAVANFIGEFPRLRRLAMRYVRALRPEPRFRTARAAEGPVSHKIAEDTRVNLLRWGAPYWQARRECLSKFRE